MQNTEIINEWDEYRYAIDNPDFVVCYQSIDAEIAETSQCPKCGKTMRYEGCGKNELICHYDNVPAYKTRYVYAFFICDQCEIAWSI